MPTDDDRRRAIAWFALLVSLITVVGLAIVILVHDGDSGGTVAAAPAPTATAEATVTAPVPAAVQEDPIVKRLAHGRTLPFTAGPWARARWRDAVFARLRPATQERAEKVDQDGGGYGILIQ